MCDRGDSEKLDSVLTFNDDIIIKQSVIRGKVINNNQHQLLVKDRWELVNSVKVATKSVLAPCHNWGEERFDEECTEVIQDRNKLYQLYLSWVTI